MDIYFYGPMTFKSLQILSGHQGKDYCPALLATKTGNSYQMLLFLHLHYLRNANN